LCLYLGIEVVFLPVGEPKRNAVVERINGLGVGQFWERKQFRTLDEVVHRIMHVNWKLWACHYTYFDLTALYKGQRNNVLSLRTKPFVPSIGSSVQFGNAAAKH
jgi:hypothetical protein